MTFSAAAGKWRAIIAGAHPFFLRRSGPCIMSIFLRLGCILAPRFPLLSPRFGSGRRLVDSKQYLAIGLCRLRMLFYCAVISACIAQ